MQRDVPSACGIFLKYSHTALLDRLSADPIEAISEEDPASPVSPLKSALAPLDAITDFSIS